MAPGHPQDLAGNRCHIVEEVPSSEGALQQVPLGHHNFLPGPQCGIQTTIVQQQISSGQQAVPHAQHQAIHPLHPDPMTAQIVQQLAMGASILQTGRFLGMLPASSSTAAIAMPGMGQLQPPAAAARDPPQPPPCPGCSYGTHDRRKRRRCLALKREDPHSLSLHEDLELGSHLGELRRMVSQAAGTVGGCSLQAVQPALAGIAAARHLPEVIRRLKQKNLEAIHLHPEWLQRFPVCGRSALDLYAAFARGDMAFTVPMLLKGQSEQVPLGCLLKHNVPVLYMQTLAGLAEMEPLTHSANDAMGQAFSVAVGQCKAIFIALVETPRFSIQAAHEYLMRDSQSGLDVTQQEMMMRIQGCSKLGISPEQKAQARHLLDIHDVFVSELATARAQLTSSMAASLAAESAAPFSVPSRIRTLCEQAHEMNQIVGLAMEAECQAGRKYTYELLSPWQAGILKVLCWPAIPQVPVVLRALAGYNIDCYQNFGFPAKIFPAYYDSRPSTELLEESEQLQEYVQIVSQLNFELAHRAEDRVGRKHAVIKRARACKAMFLASLALVLCLAGASLAAPTVKVSSADSLRQALLNTSVSDIEMQENILIGWQGAVIVNRTLHLSGVNRDTTLNFGNVAEVLVFGQTTNFTATSLSIKNTANEYSTTFGNYSRYKALLWDAWPSWVVLPGSQVLLDNSISYANIPSAVTRDAFVKQVSTSLDAIGISTKQSPASVYVPGLHPLPVPVTDLETNATVGMFSFYIKNVDLVYNQADNPGNFWGGGFKWCPLSRWRLVSFGRVKKMPEQHSHDHCGGHHAIKRAPIQASNARHRPFQQSKRQ
ncbi:hypothetical protein WJX84_005354 [Apatococcus fuscideae]|uniref:Uncharacterized protein n=1 Tax=Apatococcus fuscideae TaxID=2026836 RepID=A0AAW1TEU7_9CHLO